jgi:hypothetical protein
LAVPEKTPDLESAPYRLHRRCLHLLPDGLGKMLPDYCGDLCLSHQNWPRVRVRVRLRRRDVVRGLPLFLAAEDLGLEENDRDRFAYFFLIETGRTVFYGLHLPVAFGVITAKIRSRNRRTNKKPYFLYY